MLSQGKIYEVAYDQTMLSQYKVFAQINDRINDEMAAHPEYADDVAAQKQISIHWELF
jgi:hypothetical protein